MPGQAQTGPRCGQCTRYRSTWSTPSRAQALLGLGDRVLAARVELGGDEHLVARHAAVPQRLADARLVAVGLGGVDVPVPELERPAHGVHARRPVRHLPDAEPEHGQLVSVGELRELHGHPFRCPRFPRGGPPADRSGRARTSGSGAPGYASVASRVISGTPASARLTGQPALAASACLDERGLVDAGHPARRDQRDLGDGGRAVDEPQASPWRRSGPTPAGVPACASDVRQRHREAGRVGGGDQLLGVGARDRPRNGT